MEMNIKNVAKALGISTKSAEALDALDGKSDKQVKQSIYDEAARLLNMARTSKGDRSIFGNVDFRVEVYNALENDINSIMGYVKPEPIQNTNCEITNDLPKERSIDLNNTNWKSIVLAFYPKLVETCNGEMFGQNGAIRMLQKALCTDAKGNVDHEKLNNLIMSNSLPNKIILPNEVNGVKVDKNLINSAMGDNTGILNREELLGASLQKLKNEE